MPDDEAEEMTSRLARGGNFLVLTINKTKKQVRGARGKVRLREREHLFFKVESAKTLRFRPFDTSATIAAYNNQIQNSQLPYLEPDQGTEALPLIDSNNNDILRNDEDDFLAYHITAQPLQEDIRVYPQIPDTQPGGVFPYLGSNRPAATAGDIVGYVDGNDNPNWYDPEADVTETLVWNGGTATDISYQFYNASAERRLTPKLNIFGAGYILSPIVDETVKRNILDAVSRNDPAVTHLTIGAIRDSFTIELPDNWDNVDNSLEETEPQIPTRFREPRSSPSTGAGRTVELPVDEDGNIQIPVKDEGGED